MPKPTEIKENQNIDKIYVEAWQWVRMSNTIVWSAGNFLIPASIAPFAFLFTTTFELKTIHHFCLAVISVGIAFIWCRITITYYKTTTESRKTLSSIEHHWKDQKEINLLYADNQSELLGIDLEKTETKSTQPENGLFRRNWDKLKLYWENPIIKLQMSYAIALACFWLIVIFIFCHPPERKATNLSIHCNHSCNSSNNSNLQNLNNTK